MPGDFQKLVSLQTLTCFVAGPTGSECSGVGELHHLNLGGQLELNQLENVTEEDAKTANLGKKKELVELTLKWTVGCRDDAKVLEGLKPHNGLQAVRIESYGGTTFPAWMAMLQNMVEIHLFNCKKLRWLFGCDTSFTSPNLVVFTLQYLECLEGWWEIKNKEQGEEIIFPRLEKLSIVRCGKLTLLPDSEKITALLGQQKVFPKLTMKAKSPKLSVLDMEGSEEDMFLWVARHMASFTKLTLKNRDVESTSAVADHSLTEVVDAMEKWNHKDFPLKDMDLSGFKSAVTELCAYFKQLQHLSITDCAALVHWPEKEFQGLVSLRTLEIWNCKQLVGYAQAPTVEQSTTTSESLSQLLPRLESLNISGCTSLVEIFKLPASLRVIRLRECTKLKSISSRRLQQGEEAPPILQGSPVCLEDLDIYGCDSLIGALNLPPSLKKVSIYCCSELTSVEFQSGVMPLLKGFQIAICKKISSLPDGPQAYPSLRGLEIYRCPGIKRLPTCLQQRLSSLNVVALDAHHQEPSVLNPKSWRNAFRRD